MTDGGTRVPLIASWPGVAPKGKVYQDLVDFTDFLPTLCECAGVSVPEKLSIDGRSFLPQLKGEKGQPREWIYCWYNPRGGPTGKEFARNQRYKLYRTGQFYDISADVPEKKPLADGALDEKAKAVKKMLQDALDKHKDARPEKFRGKAKGGKKKKN
jgi:arylsulfatase A